MARVLVNSGPQPYAQQIQAGNHHWTADEPIDKGGQDLGPTPSQLLLSSLGSCIAITLRMYATRKQWSLESVEVSVEGHHLTSPDPASPGYAMDVTLRLEGTLTDEQKLRLLEMAGRCPVKRILSGGVSVKTSLLSN